MLDTDNMEKFFDTYSDILSKITDASFAIGVAIDKTTQLYKMIHDDDRSELLKRRLHIKLILGILFPARKHLDRLIIRMRTCISDKDGIADETKQPTFGQVL